MFTKKYNIHIAFFENSEIIKVTSYSTFFNIITYHFD